MNSITRTIFSACLLAMSGLSFAGPVNVNTADAKTIAKELHGVGSAKAEMIVAYREENGPFTNADQLRQIKGIGKKTVERNREYIRLQDD